jgi:hypothetical protein
VFEPVVFNESSCMHGLTFREFDSLPDGKKSLLCDMIGRISEQAFRRGFQQGWDSRHRGDKVCDLVKWRFHTSLGVSLSPHGYMPTTAIDRVQIENDMRFVGLFQPQSHVEAGSLRKYVEPLFPSLFKRSGISKKLRFAILRRDGFRCRYCGASSNDVRLHVDHVVPRVDGGADSPENLVAACADCNLGKGVSRATEEQNAR